MLIHVLSLPHWMCSHRTVCKIRDDFSICMFVTSSSFSSFWMCLNLICHFTHSLPFSHLFQFFINNFHSVFSIYFGTNLSLLYFVFPISSRCCLCVLYSIAQQIKDELCEVVAEMEALDLQEDCKHSNKDKQMSIGRKKFNMDPKKGKFKSCFYSVFEEECFVCET